MNKNNDQWIEFKTNLGTAKVSRNIFGAVSIALAATTLVSGIGVMYEQTELNTVSTVALSGLTLFFSALAYDKNNEIKDLKKFALYNLIDTGEMQEPKHLNNYSKSPIISFKKPKHLVK